MVERPIDSLRDEAQLVGRTARCGSCTRTHASSIHLPFFEYWGEGSVRATQVCSVCGYYEVTHDPTMPHMARPVMPGATKTRYEQWIAQVGAHDFIPRGPAEQDTYYCGCRGWD